MAKSRIYRSRAAARSTAAATCAPREGGDLYRRACELRDNHSCVAYAQMLDIGVGAPHDHAAAAVLRERLCAEGDFGSCGTLGLSLSYGPPRPPQREWAIFYLEKACGGHYWDACSRLPTVKLSLACDKGDAAACKSVGRPSP